MNETDILLGIIELASTGKAASPEDAVSHIAVLIGRLDPADEAYEVEFEALLKVGATIWQLAQATG